MKPQIKPQTLVNWQPATVTERRQILITIKTFNVSIQGHQMFLKIRVWCLCCYGNKLGSTATRLNAVRRWSAIWCYWFNLQNKTAFQLLQRVFKCARTTIHSRPGWQTISPDNLTSAPWDRQQSTETACCADLQKMLTHIHATSLSCPSSLPLAKAAFGVQKFTNWLQDLHNNRLSSHFSLGYTAINKRRFPILMFLCDLCHHIINPPYLTLLSTLL